MVVSARGAGLSMSETADVLKFSHAIASRIYTAVNDIKKKKESVKGQVQIISTVTRFQFNGVSLGIGWNKRSRFCSQQICSV